MMNSWLTKLLNSASTLSPNSELSNAPEEQVKLLNVPNSSATPESTLASKQASTTYLSKGLSNLVAINSASLSQEQYQKKLYQLKEQDYLEMKHKEAKPKENLNPDPTTPPIYFEQRWGLYGHSSPCLVQDDYVYPFTDTVTIEELISKHISHLKFGETLKDAKYIPNIDLIYTSKASIPKLPAPVTPDPVALPGKVGYKLELNASLPPGKFNIVPSAQANLEASANYYSGQQKYYIKDAVAGGLGGGMGGLGGGLSSVGLAGSASLLSQYTPKSTNNPYTKLPAGLTPEQIKAIKSGGLDHLLDKEDQTPVESKQLEVIEAPTGRKFRDED
jgi:hypothetical protein